MSLEDVDYVLLATTVASEADRFDRAARIGLDLEKAEKSQTLYAGAAVLIECSIVGLHVRGEDARGSLVACLRNGMRWWWRAKKFRNAEKLAEDLLVWGSDSERPYVERALVRIRAGIPESAA